MSRSSQERFDDILGAVDRCLRYRSYLAASDPAIVSMAHDAVLRNFAVIGEAARVLPEEVTGTMPDIPWAAIAGLRNVVVHEYFRIAPGLILDILDNQLVPLSAALRRDTR